jgi:hypothetical protein
MLSQYHTSRTVNRGPTFRKISADTRQLHTEMTQFGLISSVLHPLAPDLAATASGVEPNSTRPGELRHCYHSDQNRLPSRPLSKNVIIWQYAGPRGLPVLCNSRLVCFHLVCYSVLLHSSCMLFQVGSVILLNLMAMNF